MKVKIEHYRVPFGGGNHPTRGLPQLCERRFRKVKGASLWPCGGYTVCEFIENDELIAREVAFCSMADNFSYRRGREIAIGRARSQLEKKHA